MLSTFFSSFSRSLSASVSRHFTAKALQVAWAAFCRAATYGKARFCYDTPNVHGCAAAAAPTAPIVSSISAIASASTLCIILFLLIAHHLTPTTHVAPAPPLRSVPALPQHGVEPHRGADDSPDHHLPDGGRHVEHHQSVEQHAHDQGANNGVGDFAAAAEQRRASDHGRRDGLQLEPLA